MQLGTILLLLLAIVIAATVAYVQYFFRNKKQAHRNVLAALRFMAVLVVLVLLINPKFEKNTYRVEKPHLVITADNSSSIKNLKGDDQLLQAMDRLKSEPALQDRFSIDTYTFGGSLSTNDTLNFTDSNSDIAIPLQQQAEIYRDEIAALILLTDGNQTLGKDYEYIDLGEDFSLYPIVLGDTTTYRDLRIDQVNVNKYAFLKNEFPVETTIVYTGETPVSANFEIILDGTVAHRETIQLTKGNNVKTIITNLKANTVGLRNLKTKVTGIADEKYLANNTRQTFIEVIDEKTTVLLVSSIKHPDIGALTKAIEANEQRSVSVVQPNVSTSELDEADIVIMYQPTTSFRGVYEAVANRGLGILTVTGPNTDWSFLNAIQNNYSKESFNQLEDIIPSKNDAYTVFDISGFAMDDFPPLKAYLGDLLITKPFDAIAYQEIKGVTLKDPLFVTMGQNGNKEVLLLGENIWKWRVQSYRNERNFEAFDQFIGKLIRFLGDSKKRSRLELDYEIVYQGSGFAKIGASYFDESYSFKRNGDLELRLTNTDGNVITRPLLLKQNNYEADMSDLPAGDYSFSVTEKNEKLTKTGKFSISDFDLEQQFLSANHQKMNRLATRNNGALYYPDQLDLLITKLLDDNKFVPIQKSTKNIVSLIDFRVLLALLAMLLTAEWIIRKYNGLL